SVRDPLELLELLLDQDCAPDAVLEHIFSSRGQVLVESDGHAVDARDDGHAVDARDDGCVRRIEERRNVALQITAHDRATKRWRVPHRRPAANVLYHRG